MLDPPIPVVASAVWIRDHDLRRAVGQVVPVAFSTTGAVRVSVGFACAGCVHLICLQVSKAAIFSTVRACSPVVSAHFRRGHPSRFSRILRTSSGVALACGNALPRAQYR